MKSNDCGGHSDSTCIYCGASPIRLHDELPIPICCETAQIIAIYGSDGLEIYERRLQDDPENEALKAIVELIRSNFNLIPTLPLLQTTTESAQRRA